MIFKGGGDASGGGGGVASDINLNKVGGTAVSGANVVDAGNAAFRVNVVAGGGAGGTSSTFAVAFPGTGTAAGFIDSTGKMAGANLDASGNLKISGTVIANAGSGTMAVSGTVAVSNFPGTQPISGTVTANQGGAPWAENITQLAGTAVDTNSGSKSAGTLRVVIATDQPALTNALKVDGSGVTQPVSGTVAISGTVPVSGTVTANIGATNGLALDSSVTGLQVAQGSTTSGEKGSLMQGAVTTNAPSYTTAQTDPLSLDTSGLLRVSLKDTPQNTNAFKVDGSGVTQPVSGTVTVNGSVSVSNFPATQAVSGTVTANQGTANASPWNENVAQFGGSAVATGTGASGAGIPRVTVSNDSNVLATQSGTWNIATVTAVTAITNALPAGANVIGKVSIDQTTPGTTNLVQIGGSLPAGSAVLGHVITDTNSVTDVTDRAARLLGHVTVDSGAITVSGSVTTTAGTDTTGSANALNALNATATVALAGQNSVGVNIAAGTLQGTIVTELSFDGGSNWIATFFYATDTGLRMSSVTLTNANPVTALTIVGSGGATHARVRVGLYTSGTATATLIATTQVIPNLAPIIQAVVNDTPSAVTDGTVQPLSLTQEGRLRVQSVDYNTSSGWNGVWSDPWKDSDSAWEMTNSYIAA